MNNLVLNRKILSELVLLTLFISVMSATSLVPNVSAGTTWYVDSVTGNDANTCSSSIGPCKTIQAAINKASSGDTINVAAGTYAGSDVTNPGAGKSLNIVSTVPYGATIDCGLSAISGFQFQYASVSDVTIDGFKITHCPSGIVFAGLYTLSNIVIKNTDIYSNTNYGIYAISSTLNGLTIENVKLRLSGSFEGMHIANTGTVTNLVMKNSELSNNKGFGFVSYGTLNGATFDTVKILNNGGSGMGLRGTANDVAITGCTFSGSAWEELDLGFWGGAFSTTGITITSNNFLTTSAWYDIYIDPVAKFSAGTIKISYNNFLKIWSWGVQNNAATKVDAYNNWWGRQAGPGGSGAHVRNANYDPWLVVTATASPASLFVGATSTITADMTKNSAGVDTSGTGHIPDGTQIAFATDLGSIGSSSVPTTDGKATTTLTSLTLGTAHVTVSAPPYTTDATATTTVEFTVLAGKQSVLEDLKALRATVTDKEDGKKLDEAIDHLTKSLDSDLWVDGNHLNAKHGDKVFNEEKDAVVKLLELIKDKKSTLIDAQRAMLQGFIDRLVGADKALALVAIEDALAASGDAKKIDKANDELSKGDARAVDGKFVDAIEHYRNAWKHAIEAV